MERTASVTATRRSWPLAVALWVMFTASVAATGLLLLHACGLVTLPGGLRAIFWNFCPQAPVALSAEAQRADGLRKLARQLETGLAEKRLACANLAAPQPTPLELPAEARLRRPQQTAELKPPPGPLPADRWAKKDLGMLNGCWQLGRDSTGVRGDPGTPSREDNCAVKAGRMCFDADGRGQRSQETLCPVAGPILCSAPVTAHFASDGTFRTTQPATQCQGGAPTTWLGYTLTCRRVDGDHAICHSHVD